MATPERLEIINSLINEAGKSKGIKLYVQEKEGPSEVGDWTWKEIIPDSDLLTIKISNWRNGLINATAFIDIPFSYRAAFSQEEKAAFIAVVAEKIQDILDRNVP